jgi:cytoskeletal protein CcmA (bactofilin family)
VLGEHARLEGSVVADEVMVRGSLTGLVHALRVTLEAGSHVEAKVVHKSLSVEKGTFFRGESRPAEDPLSAAPEVRGPECRPAHDGRLEEARPPRKLNRFIKSFPESASV